MSDQSLRRADELLTELVEQVETARAVPMSSSCVLPRERLLDLLDELREVLPVEIDEARRVIASRDALLHDAYAEATTVRERATSEAEVIAANAAARATDLVHSAEVQAYETVERGKDEHAALVSATTVHKSATATAAQLRHEADEYSREVRQQGAAYYEQLAAEADQYVLATRADAQQYAAQLSADSEDYADRTLYELASTLQRAAATAEQGRVALAHRRSAHAAEQSDPDAATSSLAGLVPPLLPVSPGAPSRAATRAGGDELYDVDAQAPVSDTEADTEADTVSDTGAATVTEAGPATGPAGPEAPAGIPRDASISADGVSRLS